jgi:hypothetical protein
MRTSTPRELHALVAFAQELHGIKELFAQREWAMHDATGFDDTVPPPVAQVARHGAAPSPEVRDPLRLSVTRSSTRR